MEATAQKQNTPVTVCLVSQDSGKTCNKYIYTIQPAGQRFLSKAKFSIVVHNDKNRSKNNNELLLIRWQDAQFQLYDTVALSKATLD